jgi:hypothetical protein
MVLRIWGSGLRMKEVIAMFRAFTVEMAQAAEQEHMKAVVTDAARPPGNTRPAWEIDVDVARRRSMRTAGGRA